MKKVAFVHFPKTQGHEWNSPSWPQVYRQQMPNGRAFCIVIVGFQSRIRPSSTVTFFFFSLNLAVDETSFRWHGVGVWSPQMPSSPHLTVCPGCGFSLVLILLIELIYNMSDIVI
ncbi:hypothetical protein AVEN_181631-1 [Araneus ventricosus]|uniref:Uncharacterized protein n=1 Tax=Araneus ventricosus TaxID=182803 RepID=A0A4Y2CNG2_ARAVE|nr:hypothetical protein AVEN_181631-1 [Araneus ventricosus]